MQNRSSAISPKNKHIQEPVFQAINRPPMHIRHRSMLWDGEKELHYHNRVEIGLCTGGSGIFYIRDEIYPCIPGDIVIVYPGEKHDARSPRENACYWRFIMVDIPGLYGTQQDCEALLALTSYTQHRGHICSRPERKRLLPLLLRMFELRDEAFDRPDTPAHLAHLFACFLYETAHFAAETAEGIPTTEVSPALQQVVYPAVSYMLNHYAEPLRMEELAARCYVSDCHLRRSFFTAFGLSPTAFLHKIRIRHACAALAGGQQSILSIAVQCGYPTISSFNRQFQKVMHTTPSEYRRQMGTDGRRKTTQPEPGNDSL